MAGVNASLLAVVAALALAGIGWAAIHISQAGFDYMHSRGNPRNRAQAHETLWDIGKGTLLILGAGALATFAIATLKFG